MFNEEWLLISGVDGENKNHDMIERNLTSKCSAPDCLCMRPMISGGLDKLAAEKRKLEMLHPVNCENQVRARVGLHVHQANATTEAANMSCIGITNEHASRVELAIMHRLVHKHWAMETTTTGHLSVVVNDSAENNATWRQQ